MNLIKPQELQTFYYNKHVKKRLYWPEKFVWLSAKHIKTKQNLKFEYKYFDPFDIVEAIKNQAYTFKLSAKLCIYFVFYILFLKKDITRRETVDQKIANQFKFVKKEKSEQRIDLILDSMIFAKKAVNNSLPELYYFIYQKKEIYIEDI